MAPEFRPEKVERIEKLASVLTLTKSTRSGRPEPFHLLPFQRELLRGAFGWWHNDRRLVRKVYLQIARKNGKTQLAALIALSGLLLADEMSPEVYMAATTRDQASLCYAAARDMIRSTPELAEHCYIRESSKEITFRNNAGKLKALSSDGPAQHGLNPSMVIIDEFHAWGKSDEELYAALTTGSVARKNPLLVIITTAGFDRHSMCYAEYEYASKVRDGVIEDPSYLAMIHEAPQGCALDDRAAWALANPALGEIISADELAIAAGEAQRRPDQEAKFRRLHLNQWTETETAWIDPSEWDACKGLVTPESPCYGGLDIGRTQDLSAVALLYGGRAAKVMLWMPSDGVAAAEKNDGVPYSRWIKDGLISTTPGAVIDRDAIVARIIAEHAKTPIAGMSYDRAFASEAAAKLEAAGIPMIELPQRPIHMNGPTRRLQEMILDRSIVHEGSPVMRWMLANCMVEENADGLIRLVKSDRQRRKRRIDGIVALVMAVDRVQRQGAAMPALEFAFL